MVTDVLVTCTPVHVRCVGLMWSVAVYVRLNVQFVSLSLFLSVSICLFG